MPLTIMKSTHYFIHFLIIYSFFIQNHFFILCYCFFILSLHYVDFPWITHTIYQCLCYLISAYRWSSWFYCSFYYTTKVIISKPLSFAYIFDTFINIYRFKRGFINL